MDDITLLIILTLGQAIVWSWLYDVASPLCGGIMRLVCKKKQYVDNLRVNNAADFAAMYQLDATKMSDEAIATLFATDVVIVVHHALGVTMMMLGWAHENPLFFRIGLSFEIGEDVEVERGRHRLPAARDALGFGALALPGAVVERIQRPL